MSGEVAVFLLGFVTLCIEWLCAFYDWKKEHEVGWRNIFQVPIYQVCFPLSYLIKCCMEYYYCFRRAAFYTITVAWVSCFLEIFVTDKTLASSSDVLLAILYDLFCSAIELFLVSCLGFNQAVYLQFELAGYGCM